MKNAIYWSGLAVLTFLTCARAQQPWQIHEWGTFTSLQDESGRAIGGINTDDEPVPPFVHRLGFAVLSPTEEPPIYFQAAPSCHPDVTMRLETPVIYFHPPPGQQNIQDANVKVEFRGGWLTEFFPGATPNAPGLTNGSFRFPHLLSTTTGSLEWDDLQIGRGDDWPLTNTSAHVWTSPRAVQSDLVRNAEGESEKFLFYRGVGHIDAPLRISRDADTGELMFRSQLEDLQDGDPLKIQSMWLVDIRDDGEVAFRPLPPLTLDPDPNKVLIQTPAEFSSDEFDSANLDLLKCSLKSALVREGLFDDEAQALLNTWELSYFKSPGLRVFFLVPRAWTDHYLPLQISLPSEIRRVMVGRIELVTPEERTRLRKLAAYSPAVIHSDAVELYTNFYGNFAGQGVRLDARSREEFGAKLLDVERGDLRLSDIVSVPESYQTYLGLGRFRNALLLDEAQNRPTEGLTKFIATYRLQAYHPAQN
jgi:hypothetical protein